MGDTSKLEQFRQQIDSLADPANMCIGNAQDETNIYVELRNGGIPGLAEYDTLLLFHIHVPVAYRHQGLCKRLLDVLEERQRQRGGVLAVGPLMETGEEGDEGYFPLEDVLKRRGGYRAVMPFSMFRSFSRVVKSPEENTAAIVAAVLAAATST
jgi:hypothetical protein